MNGVSFQRSKDVGDSECRDLFRYVCKIILNGKLKQKTYFGALPERSVRHCIVVAHMLMVISDRNPEFLLLKLLLQSMTGKLVQA